MDASSTGLTASKNIFLGGSEKALYNWLKIHICVSQDLLEAAKCQGKSRKQQKNKTMLLVQCWSFVFC